MKIRFQGLQELDSNNYDFIMIKDDPNTGDINVKVQNKNGIKLHFDNYPDVPIKFSQRIKKMDSTKKLDELLDYIINNNRFLELQGRQILPFYEETFIIIKTNRAVIALKLYTNKIVLDKLLNKYFYDRNKITQEEQFDKYRLQTGYSSAYQVKPVMKNNDKNYQLELTLHLVHGDFYKQDKQFLEVFLRDKLSQVSEPLRLEKPIIFERNYDYKDGWLIIRTEYFDIQIDPKLVEFVEPLIQEHNLKIQSQTKQKQLKMEGF